jgi:four helix bundle protein
MKQRDLRDRLFNFAVRVIKFLRHLPKEPEATIIRYQLAKSSTSSGANYEESQAGGSRADFSNKIRISLREARESNYWLRIVNSSYDFNNEVASELNYLIKESGELISIHASILNKTPTN